MGIHHQLLAGAEHRPEATAWWWVERDRTLTFAAAVEQVDRMAGALAALGVGPGAPVGVHAHSGLDFVVALFGAFDPAYPRTVVLRQALESAGLVLSGTSPDNRLVEMIELDDHPYFVGCQFHPEFKSRPMAPHPLFAGFVNAAIRRRQETERVVKGTTGDVVTAPFRQGATATRWTRSPRP